MPTDEALQRHEHHDRLLEGMTRAVAARGYANTTIADIVREAGVSRRSFYEHFATKADCLVSLYRTASEQALAVLANAVDPLQPWETQVEHAVAAYLGFLAEDPALLRMLFVEILGLGLTGLAVRRETNLRIAGFIHASAVEGGEPLIAGRLALTIVGGINELILQAVEAGPAHDLQDLVAPATQLIFAVARGGRAPGVVARS